MACTSNSNHEKDEHDKSQPDAICKKHRVGFSILMGRNRSFIECNGS